MRLSTKHTLAAILGVMLLLGATAQSQTETPTTDETPGPAVDRLRHYQIADDEASLVEALRHENATVRWLAAVALADKADLFAAFLFESVPATRLNMGVAIAELGDVRGTRFLENTCRDQASPAGLVIQAAEHLLWAGNEVCLDPVLAILESPSNYRAAVLPMLPGFHKTSKAQFGRMRELAGVVCQTIMLVCELERV